MNRVRGRSTPPSHLQDSDREHPNQARGEEKHTQGQAQEHARRHESSHEASHEQAHNSLQSLFDEPFALRGVHINDLIRDAFKNARTGFEPKVKEGRNTFSLPQWPGLVWPYLIDSRGTRDEETLEHQHRAWGRRFHGIHPAYLEKAKLSANQSELDVANPTPGFFGAWMDRVSSVLPDFIVGGGGMAVASHQGTNRWSARNTYRLTVWTMLQAASKYLGEIKVGIATPGGLNHDHLLHVSLNQKTAFEIVQPAHENGLFEMDSEGKVKRDENGLAIPVYKRDKAGNIVVNKKTGEPEQARKSYTQRKEEAWNDFAFGGFPTHTLFGYGFNPTNADRHFNITELSMIARVTGFQDTGARRPGVARQQTDIVLTSLTACYAYAMRVRIMQLLNQPATPPEDLIRRFTGWWMDLPERESRMVMHLIFSPGERPYGLAVAMDTSRRNYAYLADEAYFQMALGLSIPEGWKARQKVRDRQKEVATSLDALMQKCPWPNLAKHVLAAVSDFRTPGAGSVVTQILNSESAQVSAALSRVSNPQGRTQGVGAQNPESDWGGGQDLQSRTGGVVESDRGGGRVGLGGWLESDRGGGQSRTGGVGAVPNPSEDTTSESPNRLPNSHTNTRQPASVGNPTSGTNGTTPESETDFVVNEGGRAGKSPLSRNEELNLILEAGTDGGGDPDESPLLENEVHFTPEAESNPTAQAPEGADALQDLGSDTNRGVVVVAEGSDQGGVNTQALPEAESNQGVVNTANRNNEAQNTATPQQQLFEAKEDQQDTDPIICTLKGADEALERRFAAFGLTGGTPVVTGELRGVLKALAEVVGSTGVPVGQAVIEKGMPNTPWTPRGLWLLLDAFRRTRRLKSPAGLVARLLKGDLTASTGGILPMVNDIMALAEANSRSNWGQCPFGPPPIKASSLLPPKRENNSLVGDEDLGPLFATARLTTQQATEIDRQAKAAEVRNLQGLDRWAALQASLDTLPEDERLYVRLCLGLREAMDSKGYFWTEVVSPAKFLGVQGNNICLGVHKKVWRGALMLDDCMPGFLPEAQAVSGVKMSVVFEKLTEMEG